MKVLWAGWGDLGRRATPHLVAAGHEVVALRRSEIADPPDGVTPLVGDLEAPAGITLPSGITTCIVTLTAGTRDRAGYERSYVTGSRNLLSLLKDKGIHHKAQVEDHPIRVVFASSSAVYGENDGSWVEEATSTSPSRFNGEVMQAAEAVILDDQHIHGVVARLGGIYGPGRERLLRTAERSTPVSARWTNRIHADDAARSLVHLATAPRPLVPDVVNIVDREPARKHDVVSFIATELGLATPPLDSDATSRGKRVDGTRLVTTGFTHEYPSYREGYRAVIASRRDT